MGEASRNRTRPITAEGVLTIFRECGLGPPEVTHRICLLAEWLSSGREDKQLTGPEFKRSEEAFATAPKLLDIIEAEMGRLSQLARENPQLREACRADRRKLRAAAKGITGLNETELIIRAPWASQKPRLRIRSYVASQVFSILEESGEANLTFPASENARVTEVTTKLLQATVEPGATEVTVRQTIKRLKHGKPTQTKNADIMSGESST